MGKFNLSEAAKEILSSTVNGKKSGQDKPSKLSGNVAYGTKEVEIGHAPQKTTDALPEYTKGTPSATAPGATPPVGSEPAKHLKNQPGEHEGSAHTDHEEDEESYDNIRDRKPSKLAKQTMQPNKGATFQQYEDTEVEGDVVAEEKEKGEKHADAEEDKEMIKKAIAKAKMKEDIDALLEGENLSEEFANKAATIFEAAVVARAEEVVAMVESELHEQFQVAVEEIKEDLAAKVDDYLNYMVEEWVTENQIAIEKGLRAEITEDFINGLRNLFVEHYIDIPAEKVEVVEALASKVEELEAALNEQINVAVELTKSLNEQKKIEAIYTACEGLSQTQVEKLKSLAEGVEFTTEEEFAAKVETLKESYFKTDVVVADNSALDDEVLIEEEKKVVKSADPSIDQYVKTISQTLIK